MGGVDPEIGVMLREVFLLAIAPGDCAGGDAGAAAGCHVGGGISDEEAVSGADAEGFEGAEQDVGLGFGWETVGSLDVIEVMDQGELFEDQTSGGSAFGSGGGFSSAQAGESGGDSGIDAGRGVFAGGIDGAVFLTSICSASGSEKPKSMNSSMRWRPM